MMVEERTQPRNEKMIRIGIISDVHADARTLREALELMARMECDNILCAGDLVNYGQQPEEVIAILREHGVACIQGNHDRWTIDPILSPDAEMKFSTGTLEFLKTLPKSWSASIDGVSIAMRHGSSKSDMDGIHPDQVAGIELKRELEQADADVFIVGHTHIPFRLLTRRGIVINPGALLRETGPGREDEVYVYDPAVRKMVPVKGTGGGTFGVLELPAKRFTVRRASDGSEVEIVRKTF